MKGGFMPNNNKIEEVIQNIHHDYVKEVAKLEFFSMAFYEMAIGQASLAVPGIDGCALAFKQSVQALQNINDRLASV